MIVGLVFDHILWISIMRESHFFLMRSNIYTLQNSRHSRHPQAKYGIHHVFFSPISSLSISFPFFFSYISGYLLLQVVQKLYLFLIFRFFFQTLLIYFKRRYLYLKLKLDTYRHTKRKIHTKMMGPTTFSLFTQLSLYLSLCINISTICLIFRYK